MLICFLPRPLGSRPGIRPESAPIILRYYRLIGGARAMGEPCFASWQICPCDASSFRRACAPGRYVSAFSCVVGTARAGGLNDLLNQKDLTPESLARGFADFTFELASPDAGAGGVFTAQMRRLRGLSPIWRPPSWHRRGYTTKLVVVMMSTQTHVVCYVKEAGGFLDYNHRARLASHYHLRRFVGRIAGKVAGDFRSHGGWPLLPLPKRLARLPRHRLRRGIISGAESRGGSKTNHAARQSRQPRGNGGGPVGGSGRDQLTPRSVFVGSRLPDGLPSCRGHGLCQNERRGQ